MDFAKTPLLQAITSRMHWLTQNQEVLSQNISNADTPGYTARGLKEQDFRQVLAATGADGKQVPGPAPVRLASASSMHIPQGGYGSGGFDMGDSPVFEETRDGNTVVLEDELIKVGQNQLDYGLMTSLYRKHQGMLRMALGKTER
ncbi:MAG: flagellar basal body protein [Rhodothalassiaceae bacterium]